MRRKDQEKWSRHELRKEDALLAIPREEETKHELRKEDALLAIPREFVITV